MDELAPGGRPDQVKSAVDERGALWAHWWVNMGLGVRRKVVWRWRRAGFGWFRRFITCDKCARDKETEEN